LPKNNYLKGNILKQIVNIANGFKEAEDWDIKQHIDMTPEERQRIAKILRERVYGKDNPDVRGVKKLQ